MGRSPGTTTGMTTDRDSNRDDNRNDNRDDKSDDNRDDNRDVYICCKLWKLWSVTQNGEGGVCPNLLTQIISISDSAENALKHPT